MGCASSVSAHDSPAELAIKTLMLAQRTGKRCSQHNALVAASFCPTFSPADILQWIADPVLVARLF